MSVHTKLPPASFQSLADINYKVDPDKLGDTVFKGNPDDDKPALSVEDKIFLSIMEKEMYMNDENHWVAPLPFRSSRPILPNNKEQALKRLRTLQCTLEKRPAMKEHFFTFMQKMFDNDQAEPAPPLKQDEERCCDKLHSVQIAPVGTTKMLVKFISLRAKVSGFSFSGLNGSSMAAAAETWEKEMLWQSKFRKLLSVIITCTKLCLSTLD
ncbi:hypothetical protein MHYP_G00253160 [Metynnis hypsauchen]